MIYNLETLILIIIFIINSICLTIFLNDMQKLDNMNISDKNKQQLILYCSIIFLGKITEMIIRLFEILLRMSQKNKN